MQLLKPMESKPTQLKESVLTAMPRILVVDDEPDIRHLVQEILEDEGYKVEVAENGVAARQAFRKHQPNLILLDIWMPDVDGITLLKEWSKEGNLNAPVIMMSGHGTVETAVEATRLGAFDFIEKPLSLAKLLLTVEQALDFSKASITPVKTQHTPVTNRPIGRGATMQRLREQIKRIAEHDSWVLFDGEPGSDIAAAAHYLHDNSQRKNKAFIVADLSSFSYANDAEAFVGLTSQQGLLDKAQGGTLFLSGIEQADDATQHFLLHLLQDLSYQHIDSSAPLPFKARIICSTHHNLEKLVETNKFKKELFYLINVVPLHIPALREHREDIPELLSFYTDMLVSQNKLPYRHFSLAAQNRLRNHHWLGNIPELTNLVQHLLITAAENEISIEEVEAAIEKNEQKPMLEEGIPISYDLPLREARESFERAYLIHQLTQNDGNISKVAKQIGVERTHLYRKLRTLNIEPKKLLKNT